MKFSGLRSLIVMWAALIHFSFSPSNAQAKTYVYFCETEVKSQSGGSVPGTRRKSFFRDGLGNPVASLINSFCPSALQDCVNERAGFHECCEITYADAADGNYTPQVLPAFANSGRHYCKDTLPPPPPPPGPSDSVLFYHDDGSCNESNFIAAVSGSTDCEPFRNYRVVWGVKIGGQCKDVSDMEAYPACLQYRGQAGGRVRLFHDDGRCEPSNLIATVNPATDCNSLASSSYAWGVSVDGQCMDIPDTSAVDACNRYKGR